MKVKRNDARKISEDAVGKNGSTIIYIRKQKIMVSLPLFVTKYRTMKTYPIVN